MVRRIATGMSELSGLFEAYYAIGAKICEEMGHDWERQPAPEGDMMNTQGVERCQRCNETRLKPINSTSTTTFEVRHDS